MQTLEKLVAKVEEAREAEQEARQRMSDLQNEIATAERDLKEAEKAVTASYVGKKKNLTEARKRRDRAQILLANLKSELALLNAETQKRSRAVSGSETAAIVVERRDIVKRARRLRRPVVRPHSQSPSRGYPEVRRQLHGL